MACHKPYKNIEDCVVKSLHKNRKGLVTKHSKTNKVPNGSIWFERLFWRGHEFRGMLELEYHEIVVTKEFTIKFADNFRAFTFAEGIKTFTTYCISTQTIVNFFVNYLCFFVRSRMGRYGSKDYSGGDTNFVGGVNTNNTND